MKCTRCGAEYRPSMGCEACPRFDDDELARIAQETLARRTAARAGGVVFVAVALVVSLVGIVPALLIGLPGFVVTFGIVGVAGFLGREGAHRLESAKLFHHLPAPPRRQAAAATRAGPQTLDQRTAASHPGGLRADPARLRVLEPWLLEGALAGAPLAEQKMWLTRIPEHLLLGDSRAALCVSLEPFCVAAYSDELDCVAMVELPQEMRALVPCAVGQRMLTVNLYSRAGTGIAVDLVAGPRNTGTFENISAYIAEALSSENARIEARKATIDDEEWARCAEAAQEWQARFPLASARDGRPSKASAPRARKG